MRSAFINTLSREAQKNKRVWLLTGDLGFTLFEEFRDKFSDRFVNVGAAEQNMMGLATGLAMSGKIVFTYSIATFATMRPFEQIRTDIACHSAPVIIVGSGAGLSYGHDLITHHATEDIHLMRGIPGMTVLCPADPIETTWATRIAAQLKKPVYLRIGKRGEPNLYKNKPYLKLGKGSILRKGKDVALLACGNIVSNVIKAAELLNEKNIQALVVSFHTIKPIDCVFIKKTAKQFSKIVTIEEHSIIGGLGSAVAETLAEENYNIKLLRLGVPDKFVFEIGSQNHLRHQLSLTPETIAKKVKSMLYN